MRTKLIGLVAGVGLSLAAAVPAVAHHSFAAEFDANKPVTIEGTVKEFRWVNPHSWLHINVTKARRYRRGVGRGRRRAERATPPRLDARHVAARYEGHGARLHVEGRRAARQRARHHVPRRQTDVHRLVGHRRTGRAHRSIRRNAAFCYEEPGASSPRFRFRRMSFAVRVETRAQLGGQAQARGKRIEVRTFGRLVGIDREPRGRDRARRPAPACGRHPRDSSGRRRASASRTRRLSTSASSSSRSTSANNRRCSAASMCPSAFAAPTIARTSVSSNGLPSAAGCACGSA